MILLTGNKKPMLIPMLRLHPSKTKLIIVGSGTTIMANSLNYSMWLLTSSSASWLILNATLRINSSLSPKECKVETLWCSFWSWGERKRSFISADRPGSSTLLMFTVSELVDISWILASVTSPRTYFIGALKVSISFRAVTLELKRVLIHGERPCLPESHHLANSS